MINWKSILSTFNDKPTLMQWLKIVEKALENASLESVTAKTAPNNAVSFEFKFADGSTVTSTAVGLEVKGISGIEEVSDEIVGSQTLTTLRAHYTDGTTDEFPVYAQNGSPMYMHKLICSVSGNSPARLLFLSYDNRKITTITALADFIKKNKAQLMSWYAGYFFFESYVDSNGDIQVKSISISSHNETLVKLSSITSDEVITIV